MLRKTYTVLDEVQLERIAEMIETAERVYLYGKGSSVLAFTRNEDEIYASRSDW